MDYLRLRRIYKAFIVLALMLAINMGRLYYIQVGNYQKFSSKMLNQDTQTVSLEEYSRGNIYDRNNKPITGNRIENRIVVFPALMKDRKVTVMRLASILSFEISMLENEIKDYPHYLPYQISAEEAREINEAKLEGVQIAPVTFRYNDPPLAVQTIGSMRYLEKGELARLQNQPKDYQLSDLVGRDGLEKYYEAELKGDWPGKVLRAYVDGYGKLIPGLGYRLEKGPTDLKRNDLVLTLDKRMQDIAEKVTNDRLKKGAVVVLDVQSGDILAMAGKDVAGYNPAIMLQHPGSVFKIVMAAAALEEGKVTPNTLFFCEGEKAKPIKCYYNPGHGQLTFAQAMAVSCNPTFVRVGLFMLGAPKMVEYAEKMGLANQGIIGYPFPRDKRQDLNLIDNPDNIANSSIGQGPILATPVQIAAMTNVIANNGIYREPRLVIALRNGKGQVVKAFVPGEAKQVISAQTSAQINDMLRKAVLEGTGKNAEVLPGSAGKTGSAEVYENEQKRTDVWFTGYAPFDKPKYVITVFAENGEGGGQTAAPVFKEIMEQLLKLN